MASNSAYIDADLTIEGNRDGPLCGLTFAVKDMYDVSLSRLNSYLCTQASLPSPLCSCNISNVGNTLSIDLELLV